MSDKPRKARTARRNTTTRPQPVDTEQRNPKVTPQSRLGDSDLSALERAITATMTQLLDLMGQAWMSGKRFHVAKAYLGACGYYNATNGSEDLGKRAGGG